MFGDDRSRSAAAAAVCAALFAGVFTAPGPAGARPVQLEDLLQREGFGAVEFTPDGRSVLVEQRGPYASAPRFDYGQKNQVFRTRIRIAEVHGRGGLRPLFPSERGVGYELGPIAPDGARVAVFRLKADRWEVGVTTLATHRVRWLDVTGEWQYGAHAVAWLSPTELAVIARGPKDNPFLLRAMRPQGPMPQLWAEMAAGRPSRLAVGSGRFVSVRPHSPPKLLLRISTSTGAQHLLARGDFSDLEASPSGRWLATLEAAEDIPLRADRAVQGAYGTAVRRQRLGLIDLRTGAVTHPCHGCDLLASLLAWSPAHDTLLIYARRDGEPWPAGELLRMDAGTGVLRPPAPDLHPQISHRPEIVHVGWLGAEPLVFGRIAGGVRDDWFRVGDAGPVNLTRNLAAPSAEASVAGPEALLVPAGEAAWRVNRDGVVQRLETQAFQPLLIRVEGVADRSAYGVGAATALIGESGVGDDRAAIAFDAHGDLLALSALGARGQLLAASPDAALTIVDRIDGGGRETLELRREHVPPRTLAQINSRFRDLVWPRAVPVEHRGPEGQPLRSWLMLPARAPGSPPPPLVVFPYPGSSYAGDPSPGVFWAHASDPTAVLVGHGYAVLLPSLPNPQQTDGPADGLAARVLEIIDAAAGDPALAGAFDPTRLGVWGYSFGGYAALVLVAETDRFSAAVADAAPTDLFSMEGVFSPSRRVFADEGVGTAWTAGWTEDLQGGMHAPPWREPARYVHNSPSLLADHITTPVLLVQGEQDNIPLQQAEEMFSALYRQNKDAMLVTYWGESHVISSPGNLRDYSRRALAWLDDGLALSAPSSGIATPPGNLAPASANAAPSTPLLRRAATIGHPPSR